MILTGFFRCSCGKIHARAGVNIGSICVCGRKLREQSIELRPSVIVAKGVVHALAKRQGLR